MAESSYFGLIHLQIQFLAGIMSLIFLVLTFLLMNWKLYTYRIYSANLDTLTGVFSRRGFWDICTRLLKERSPQSQGTQYFLILDVDWFKEINDKYGHPAGDRVLRQLAEQMKKNFSDCGVAGRLGGDEFAVLVHASLSQEELEQQLNRLKEGIHSIDCQGLQVSCSIGIAPVGSSSIKELYHQADRALYLAKEQGRDQYVFYQKEEAPSFQ